MCYNTFMATDLIRNSYRGENETYFSYVRRYSSEPTNDVTHIHSAYEILLFYEGDANYHIGGDVYNLQKNDLLVIKPSVYHNISLNSPTTYSRTVLSFNGKVFPPNVNALLQTASPCYHIPDGHPILQIFESMRSAFEILSNDDFEQFFISATTNILMLLSYIRDSAIKNSNVTQSGFGGILSYIDKNSDKPITLAHLSKIFFLSESHISHLFKATLNTSAKQYINQKRIHFANSLLVAGSHPMQVAERCGFDNYSTFYRLYKSIFGVTPKNYDKKT